MQLLLNGQKSPFKLDIMGNYRTLSVLMPMLGKNDRLKFNYDGSDYFIECILNAPEENVREYVVKNPYGRMDLMKITRKYINLCSYDMMCQKSTYKMSLNRIKLETIIRANDWV